MRVFQQVSEWIMRLIWTNFLWLGFTLLGLVIFGIMPATIALFAVARRWTMKEFDFSIWKLFKETYFKEWKNSNKIGAIFWLIGIILFFDLSIAEQMDGFLSLFLYIFFIFLMLIFMMTLIFFFPIYVQYKFSIKEYIKQSFIYSLVSLKATFFILLGLFLIGFLFLKIPGLIPFFSGALPAYWIITVCMKRFHYLENKLATKE
ncbi:YesL family protein [Bacillus sp. FSL K6-3431]|uniref:YesL family protein n=1 Tax=Bacillus sp. FSL K6-3431 TaxID=2921500 RepID=UPI0030F7B19A